MKLELLICAAVTLLVLLVAARFTMRYFFPARHMTERHQTSKVTGMALAVFAAYVAVALWTAPSPRHPPKPGALLISGATLFGSDKTKHMFLYRGPPGLRTLEDSDPQNQRSPVILYENDKALGPAYSAHHTIEDIGLGRYAHWKDLGIMFSSSDNTDPRYNGRNYWIVIPGDTATVAKSKC
jgi:hypothetical protein